MSALDKVLRLAEQRDRYGQFGTHNIDFTPGRVTVTVGDPARIASPGGYSGASYPASLATVVPPGLKVQVQTSAQSALGRVNQLFPGEIGKPPVVRVSAEKWQPSSETAWAYTQGYNPKHQSEILVTPSLLSTGGLEEFNSRVTDAAKRKHNMTIEGASHLESVLVHEMAHVVSFNQMARHSAGLPFGEASKKYFSHIEEQYKKITGESLSWSSGVSDYALKSRWEYIAEAVVHVAGGGKRYSAIALVKAMGGRAEFAERAGVDEAIARVKARVAQRKASDLAAMKLAARRDTYGQFGTHNIDFTPGRAVAVVEKDIAKVQVKLQAALAFNTWDLEADRKNNRAIQKHKERLGELQQELLVSKHAVSLQPHTPVFIGRTGTLEEISKMPVYLDEYPKALASYTAEGYSTINYIARSSPIASQSEVIQGMDAVFGSKDALQLSEPATLLRGVHGDNLQQLSKLEVGAEYVEDGFFSVTRDEGVAEKFTWPDVIHMGQTLPGEVIEVVVPPGVTLIRGAQYESELIMNRGTRFKNHGRDENGTLRLEVVG